jgi:hypothetical protein
LVDCLDGREVNLADPHQSEFDDSHGDLWLPQDQPDNRIDPTAAKQIAKCIIEALSNAGLRIGPAAEK